MGFKQKTVTVLTYECDACGESTSRTDDVPNGWASFVVESDVGPVDYIFCESCFKKDWAACFGALRKEFVIGKQRSTSNAKDE